MIRLIRVEPRDERRIWLRYSDGSEGEIDLSDLTGKGVFQAWDAPGTFERVHLTAHGSAAWDEEIELCPDALYLELTGKSAEDVFSGLRTRVASA